MGNLSIYLPDQDEARIKAEAKAAGLSVSRLIQQALGYKDQADEVEDLKTRVKRIERTLNMSGIHD
jgi:hypothetical protein